MGPSKGRLLRNGAVFLVLLGFLLALHWAFLEEMDALAFDFALRLRGTQAPDPRIVIVAIDDGSLAEVGPWPWPPNLISGLLENILGAGPAAVGVDLILGRPPEQYPALRRAERTVLASALGARVVSDGLELFWQAPEIGREFPGISLGHIHAGKDPDGVCRSLPLAVSYAGERHWAFAVELTRRLLEVPAEDVRFEGGALQIGDRLSVPRLSTPLDGAVDALGILPHLGSDHLLINSRGGMGTFPYVSAAAVLDGRPDELARLRGRVVLVGATSYSLGDHLSTAFSGAGEMPGIEIHSNALDTILNRRFIGALGEPGATLYLFLLLLALWLLLSLWPPGRTFPLFVLLLIACLVVPLGCFLAFGYWIPAVSTAVVVVTAGATSQFLHYSTLNRQLNRRYGELSDLLREAGHGVGPVDDDGSRYRRRSLEWKLRLLADATEAALKLSRERGEITSFLSHELKTPLTSIQGFADLLGQGLLEPEDREEAAHLIRSETSRLGRLVEDYLRLSRLESGSTSFRPISLDLGEIARRTAALLDAQFRERAISIRGLSRLPHLPVEADPDLLTQILLNLLGNAVKFSPPGGEVRIDGFAGEALCVLEVTDRGIGIAEEDLPRIFEKFYRGRMDDGASPPGAGLGLAFVKEAIHRHGGTIEVESRVGVGTRVRVGLPRSVRSSEGSAHERRSRGETRRASRGATGAQ